MPMAIIITGKAIPTIIEESTQNELFNTINKLSICPKLTSQEDMKLWLNKLPQPSGWYETRADAKAAAQRAADAKPTVRMEPIDIAELVKETRAILGLSRVEFGRKLGFNGNQNTVNKTIYELENQRANLRPEKLQILNGLRAGIELNEPGSFKIEVAQSELAMT